MLDHVGIAVSDATRSKKFYDAALAPIGIALIMEIPGTVTQSGGVAITERTASRFSGLATMNKSARVFTSRSRSKREPKSMPFMLRRWLRAAATMARPVRGHTITKTITVHSYTTPMATILKLCATHPTKCASSGNASESERENRLWGPG